MFKKKSFCLPPRIFPSLRLFYMYSVATKGNYDGKVSWKGNQKSYCGSFLLLIELVLEFSIFAARSFCTRA